MKESEVKAELRAVIERARKKGNVTLNGVWVRNELEKLNWMALSHAMQSSTRHIVHAKIFYDCGYKGAYNFSRMVKTIEKKR